MNNFFARAGVITFFAFLFTGLGYFWGESAATDHCEAQKSVVEKAEMLDLITSTNQALSGERTASATLAAISFAYQQGLSNEASKQTILASSIRSHAVRLSVPTSGYSTCAASATASSTSGRNDPPRAELSVEAAEFLTALSSEADNVVQQLGACQSIVVADRETINLTPPTTPSEKDATP